MTKKFEYNKKRGIIERVAPSINKKDNLVLKEYSIDNAVDLLNNLYDDNKKLNQLFIEVIKNYIDVEICEFCKNIEYQEYEDFFGKEYNHSCNLKEFHDCDVMECNFFELKTDLFEKKLKE